MRKLITKIFFISLIITFFNKQTLIAQDSLKYFIKNSVSLNADYVTGGVGSLGGSINYERRLLKSDFFIGTGFTLYQRKVKAISLELNYLFFKNKSHIETGLAYRHIFNPVNSGELLSLNLGYKYEKFYSKGLNIKVGISPGIVRQLYHDIRGDKYENYFLFRTYMGVGYSF